MMRRIFKLAPRITLFLLAGAMMNIAVAWHALEHIRHDQMWFMQDYATIHYWFYFNRDGPSGAHFWCGFPLPVISGTMDTREFHDPQQWRFEWMGLAAATVLYAVILWLPFAALGRLRRRRRIKRGLCPACAYPVGTSDVCTECGRAIARR